MIVPPPKHCRPESYHLMAAQLDRLDEPDALWKGAVAIAMHAEPDLDPEAVGATLRQLAARIRERAPSGRHEALLAHGHDILFHEEGLEGDRKDFFDPANSYLPTVLRRRRGIPITLCLIYKCVMERLGLEVVGINAPGHFLVSVDDGGDRMYVDPYHSGRVLNREDVFVLLEEALGSVVPREDSLLTVADHRAWLVRMLRNLTVIFQRRRDNQSLLAMKELLALLSSHGQSRSQSA